MYKWATQHDTDANDNVYACVTLRLYTRGHALSSTSSASRSLSTRRFVCQSVVVKIHGILLFAKDRSGKPDKETDLLGSFSSTDYSKLDYDRVWSSQEWKAEATTHDRSRQPDKTFWRMVQKVRPDHEEVLLDGTAQSVRYGEPLRDRSGQPDNINSQEMANYKNFIMGRDTTELELSVESRLFVNQVN